MDLIFFILDSPSTTLSCKGNAPPESPVPAPRVTIGTLLALQSLSTVLICISFSGKTTARGFCR